MKARLLSLLVLSACLSQAATAQTVVARVKVQNPAGEEMRNVIVRGTLPLPANYDKPLAALAVRDEDEVLPTQASVFSTYPGSDEKHPVGRPEVVQLTFRAPVLPANAFKTFDVVQLDATPKKLPACAAGAAVSAWTGGDAPVVVEATDCFGNRYRGAASFAGGPVTSRQDGPLLAEQVALTILQPVGKAKPDQPALKRFLRVRAYLTRYGGEDFASLSLMIHNGSIDRANGAVYYRHIRVGVAEPMGVEIWRKRYSPAADATPEVRDGYTWIACPPAPPAGKVFVMPHGSAAVLRMTVYAPAAKDRALQFARHAPLFVPVPSQELFSWSNFATARYGASKYPMPLNLGADALAIADREVRDRLGSPSLGWTLTYLWERAKKAKTRPAAAGGRRTLGHAMPAGVAYGGMTGGDGIHYVYGVRAAVTGHSGLIKLHVLLADRNFDRQRVHLFYDAGDDRPPGGPFTYGRHVVEVDGKKFLDIPYTNRGRPVLQVADPACKVHADHVKAKDLLAPEARQFLRYMNHDDQHLSRVFDAVPAAYLACDPLNRDRLVTLGSQACWKRNIHPIRGRPNFGGWGSLFAARKHVDAHPHAGIAMNRSHGWVMHSLGWAFSLSQDRQIRADCIDVARTDVQVRCKAQMPAGNISFRRATAKAFKGAYDFTTAWEEGAILADGARCVVEILSAREHAGLPEAMKKTYADVGRWIATKAWNPAANAPAFHVGLRKKGAKEFLERPELAGGAAFYMGSPFAWYYELTGEQIFLDRLKQMAGRKGLPARAARDLGNWSYSLYLAQGGRIPGRKGF